MDELIYQVRIGFAAPQFRFNFDNAEEAVKFAIAAKCKNIDRQGYVSIGIIEVLNPLEDEE